VKDEGLNPTGSLKDRASGLAVAKAREFGAAVLACASTGNAASSLAGNAASAGLSTCIFVPARAPAPKLAQLVMYGARVFAVEGSYHDAYLLSEQAINHFGWYNRNAARNPYLIEGKKTVSFEIAEQLGWSVPDWVVVSVGDGCTIAGVGKGFADLERCGVTDRSPRLAGVQAEGCAPLARAWASGRPWQPEPGESTIADSIAVGTPRNPDKALRAVQATGGVFTTVSDEEITGAMRLLAKTTGVFAEPSAAAALAGLVRLVAEGTVSRRDTVAVINTGNGLKDPAAAGSWSRQVQVVAADFGEFLKRWEGGDRP
jgi:threonine synthase